MKRKTLFLCTSILLTMLMSSVYAEKIQFNCKVDDEDTIEVFILDTQSRTAKDVSKDNAPSGKLVIENHQYGLEFPKEGRLSTPTRVNINRYTGNYHIYYVENEEYIVSEYSPKKRSGKCKKVKGGVSY